MATNSKENIRQIISITSIWMVFVFLYFSIILLTIDEINPDTISVFDFILSTFIVGLTLGITNGMLEVFVFQSKFKNMKFVHVVLGKTFYFILAFILAVITVIIIRDYILHPLGIIQEVRKREFIEHFLQSEIYKHASFTIIMSFAINFLLQVNKMMGKGVLFSLFFGKYHNPRQEEKIIMFLDLTSSTSIAEKLGDLKYSAFLKDFFNDLDDAIKLSKGVVYQYVGDEVVILWDVADGCENNNCINCFTVAVEIIEKQKENYLSKYGVLPTFKAGIHYGQVIITEVGSMKSEIVYHGDSMNTAARLCAACNKYDQSLLISADLLGYLTEIDTQYSVDSIGLINLK
ncbi:MAG: adenylate/guanylate cyclase domain-containing protein, partial [Ignavibacteriaceae bacterium]